jgi:hypothetical protein
VARHLSSLNPGVARQAWILVNITKLVVII